MSAPSQDAIEAAARSIYENDGPGPPWETVTGRERDDHLALARHALAAAARVSVPPPAPVDERERKLLWTVLNRSQWQSLIDEGLTTGRELEALQAKLTSGVPLAESRTPEISERLAEALRGVIEAAYQGDSFVSTQQPMWVPWGPAIEALAEYDAVRSQPQREAAEGRTEEHVGYWDSAGYLPLTALPVHVEDQRQFLKRARPLFAVRSQPGAETT